MLCSVEGTACLEVFVFAEEGNEFCSGEVRKENQTVTRIPVIQSLSEGLPNATALRNVSSSDLGWIQEAISRLESGKLMGTIGFILRCGAVIVLCVVQFSRVSSKRYKKRRYDIAAALILVLSVMFSTISAVIYVSMVPLVEFNFADMYEKRAPQCQLFESIGLFHRPEDNVLVVLPVSLAFVTFTLLFVSLCCKCCKFDSSPSALESSAKTEARGIELNGNVSTSITKGELSSAASTISLNPVAQIDEDNSRPMPGSSVVEIHIDPKTNRRYSYDTSTGETRWI